MYLPQFHRVKENDEWWGEGFTDWTTVKNAKSLYTGHEQPHIPLDDNYYDLMDKKTMIWQSELMKKYNVDGMCIYHYWFKNSRKILEKPAENLLQWTDIDMPFCFCWANQTWARSWSNIKLKNSWANTFENEPREEESGVLLEQRYGAQRQWEEHFNYLLPFFKDSRYITIDGKPVFTIYRSAEINCIKEMLELWRELAVENGLKGLYVIGMQEEQRGDKILDAELYHEPVRAAKIVRPQVLDSVARRSYDAVWNNILETKVKGKVYFGGFVSYDDTPRMGMEGGVIEGARPDKFRQYMTELMAKNEAYGNNIVFLNAWNEWGEGMHLEPDTCHKYGYLEAVSYAKEHYQDHVAYYRKHAEISAQERDELVGIKAHVDKFEHYLNILDFWMNLRENGVKLENWFIENDYRNIGLYGYGVLGKHLLRELEESSIIVSYLVDRQKNSLRAALPMYLPEDSLPEADLIVVSATFYYDDIYRQLKNNGVKNIVSLEYIMREMYL